MEVFQSVPTQQQGHCSCYSDDSSCGLPPLAFRRVMMLSVPPVTQCGGLVNYLLTANKISDSRAGHKILHLFSIFESIFLSVDLRVLAP